MNTNYNSGLMKETTFDPRKEIKTSEHTIDDDGKDVKISYDQKGEEIKKVTYDPATKLTTEPKKMILVIYMK